jgi:hypothetical protein|tara:strand:+ start:14 stop:622 length:609 start_codon:yes stop_codon:yes gene_type:complete
MAYGKIKADALIHDNGGSDVEIQISGIPSASDIAAKAAIASPTFTGTPAAPTAAQGTNTTQVATTAYVQAEVGQSIQAHDADTAKTDVAQTYTAGQRGEVTTLTSSSGSVAIDFALSNNFKLTLSEPVTAITVSNATAGQSGSIFIEQPASGGPHAVGGWVAAFLFSGAAAPTITQTASKCDRVDYAILSATQIQVVWTGNY